MKYYFPAGIEPPYKYYDQCLWLFDHMYQYYIWGKAKVSLPRNYLNKVFHPSRTSEILNWFVKKGILVTDNQYKVGLYCRSYSIGEPFLSNIVPTASRKSAFEKGRISEDYVQSRENLPESYKWVIGAVEELFLAKIPEDLLVAASEKIKKPEWDWTTSRWTNPMTPAQKLNLLHNKIEMFYNNKSLKMDKFGRFHHKVTNVDSVIRRHLYLDGEKLSEIDIKTSQPCFLGEFLSGYLNSISSYPPCMDKKTLSIMKYKNVEIGKLGGKLGKMDKKVIRVDRVEFKKYMGLIESGDFYIFMRDKSGYQEIDRKDFKNNYFFPFFYGKVGKGSRKTSQVIWKVFLNEFPTIGEMFKFIKGGESEATYERLATFAQELESDFVFNKIIPALKSENIKCVTIHDSFMVKESDLKKAYDIIKSEFLKVDIKVQLEIDK